MINMKMRHNYRVRDLDRILRKNGYVHDRTRGSHIQYVKDGKKIVISIPKTNPCVWQRIVKENGLEIES